MTTNSVSRWSGLGLKHFSMMRLPQLLTASSNNGISRS